MTFSLNPEQFYPTMLALYGWYQGQSAAPTQLERLERQLITECEHYFGKAVPVAVRLAAAIPPICADPDCERDATHTIVFAPDRRMRVCQKHADFVLEAWGQA